jgi:hypothetical protein
MRLATSFDPIEIGEIDNFAFDFTADIGAATMVSTSWTCALAPFQTATDPAPQFGYCGLDARSMKDIHVLQYLIYGFRAYPRTLGTA